MKWRGARWVVGVAVVGAVGLLWWAVSGIRAVHQDAAELAWLRSDGARVTATVDEVGLANGAGLVQAVWVRTDAGQKCFVDLSRSRLTGRAVGKSIAVVLDAREPATCTGVGADMLTRGFAADYVRRVLPPVLLLIVLAGAVVLVRRRSSTTV